MSFTNPISFRLSSLNTWTYRNVLVYNKFFYNNSIKKTYFLPHFISKLFERRFYRRFDYYLSHIILDKFNNGFINYTLYIDSQFLKGVYNWFYKELIGRFYTLLLKKNILKLRVKFFRNFSYTIFVALNFIFFKLYLIINQLTRLIVNSASKLVKTLDGNVPNFKVNVRILNENSPSALSMGSLFINKLKRGSSLTRIVRSTFKNWHFGRYKNVLGLRIVCEGRFKRRQRAQHEIYSVGQIQASKVRGKVDYSLSTVHLKYGAASVRIWLTYK